MTSENNSAVVVAVVLACGWFFIRVKPLNLGVKAWAVIIFFLGLVLRLYLACVWPDFSGIDERSHYNYVKYYFDHHKRPDFLIPMDDENTHWYENHQPTAYYALGAGVLKLFHPAFPQDEVFILRILSVILSYMFPYWIFFNALKLILSSAGILSFLVLHSFLPSAVFAGSFINNDQLLLLCAALWWNVYFRGKGLIKGLRTGTFCATLLAMIKLSGLGLVCAHVISVVANRTPERKRHQMFLWGCIPISGIIFLFWHNKAYLGTYLPVMQTRSHERWASWFEFFGHATRYMVESYWAAGGQFLEQYFFIGFSWVLMCITLWGCVSSIRSRIHGAFPHMGHLVIILLLQVIMVYGFGYLHGEAQGRFLFPVNAVIFICCIRGFESILRNITDNMVQFQIIFWIFLAYVTGFLNFLAV